MKNINVIFLIAIILIISLAVYFGFFNNAKTIQQLRQEVAPTASLYMPTKDVADVLNFIDDYNNKIHLSEISKSKWQLLYFGYANCPHICPLDLQKINTTSKKMLTKDSLQVVFISIDPKRDIGNADNFAKKFNSNFIGLNMAINATDKISKKLGIYQQIIATQKQANKVKMHADNYDMNHTTSYLLLNPNLELTAILSNLHYPDDMAKALDNIIQNSR